MALPPKKKISRFKTVRKPSKQVVQKPINAQPGVETGGSQSVKQNNISGTAPSQFPNATQGQQNRIVPKTMPLQKQAQSQEQPPPSSHIKQGRRIEKSGLIPDIPDGPVVSAGGDAMSRTTSAKPVSSSSGGDIPSAIPVGKPKGEVGPQGSEARVPLAKIVSNAAKTGKTSAARVGVSQTSQSQPNSYSPSPSADIPQPSANQQSIPSQNISGSPPKAKIVSLKTEDIKQDIPVAQRIVSGGSTSENKPMADVSQRSSLSASQQPVGTPSYAQTIVKSPGELIEAEIEEVYEQIQNYLEVCDSLSLIKNPFEIIDVIHMFVISLNLDVVAFALANLHHNEDPLSVISRGFNSPPDNRVVSIWSESVNSETGIDWIKLMDIVEDTASDLAAWVLEEELGNVGYVPVHDGNLIYGFLMVGSHQESLAKSPVASPLLELCGGRIGITIAHHNLSSQALPVTTPQVSPTQGGKSVATGEILKYVESLQKEFALLLGSVEMLKVKPNLDKAEIEHFSESFKKSLSEGLHSLDLILHHVKKGM